MRNYSPTFVVRQHLQPRQQVQLLTPRLIEPIRTDIELQNPSSLQMAMALARAYERQAQAAITTTTTPKQPATPFQRTVFPQRAANMTAPAASGVVSNKALVVPTAIAAQANTTPLPAPRPAPRWHRRQLTAKEMLAH